MGWLGPGLLCRRGLGLLGRSLSWSCGGRCCASCVCHFESAKTCPRGIFGLRARPGTDLLENAGELPAGRVRGHEPVACFLTWFAPSPGSSSLQAPVYRGFAACGEDWGCRGNGSGRCQVRALGWGGVRIRACNPGLVSTVAGFVTREGCTGLRTGMSLGGRGAPTFGCCHPKPARSRLHPAGSEALQKLACIEHNFEQGARRGCDSSAFRASR